jgi:hypothetical protein
MSKGQIENTSDLDEESVALLLPLIKGILYINEQFFNKLFNLLSIEVQRFINRD